MRLPPYSPPQRIDRGASPVFAALFLTGPGSGATPALEIAQSNLGLYQAATDYLGFAAAGRQTMLMSNRLLNSSQQNAYIQLGTGQAVSGSSEHYLATIGLPNTSISGASAAVVGLNEGIFTLTATDTATKTGISLNQESDYMAVQQSGGAVQFNRVGNTRVRFPVPKTSVTIVDNIGITFTVPNGGDVTGSVTNWKFIHFPAMSGGPSGAFYGLFFDDAPSSGAHIAGASGVDLSMLAQGSGKINFKVAAATPLILDDAAPHALFAGQIKNTAAGAASTPAGLYSGAWFTGGDATTTKPQVLIEPAGATSTAWSTAGTGLGVNAGSGFTGHLLELQVNGTAKLYYDASLDYLAAANSSGYGFAARYTGVFTRSSGFYGFTSSDDASSLSADLQMFRDGADTLGQRRGANAQTHNLYGKYGSSTDYHRLAQKTAVGTASNVSGASVTLSGLIPDGAVVIGVTTKVTTSLGTGGGTTGYQVGDGSDADRWGDITGTAAGTSSDNTNATATGVNLFTSANDVVLTAKGGNFNGTGIIDVVVHYLIGQAD